MVGNYFIDSRNNEDDIKCISLEDCRNNKKRDICYIKMYMC